MKAIAGLTSIFDSLTKVVISLLALGIVVSLLGGNVPFVGEIASNIIGDNSKFYYLCFLMPLNEKEVTSVRRLNDCNKTAL